MCPRSRTRRRRHRPRARERRVAESSRVSVRSVVVSSVANNPDGRHEATNLVQRRVRRAREVYIEVRVRSSFGIVDADAAWEDERASAVEGGPLDAPRGQLGAGGGDDGADGVALGRARSLAAHAGNIDARDVRTASERGDSVVDVVDILEGESEGRKRAGDFGGGGGDVAEDSVVDADDAQREQSAGSRPRVVA